MSDGINLIIPAAGTGNRFGGSLPKQFSLIDNKTILEHTLNAFRDCNIAQCVVCIDKKFKGTVETICKRIPYSIKVVEGGTSRAESVKKGLENCLDVPFTLIHDAARPCVGKDLIFRVISELRQSKAVIPYISITDTVKEIKGNSIVQTIDRSSLAAVQTPQGFHTAMLKKAYKGQDISHFTDEASLLEALGEPIVGIKGEASNIKVTVSSDKYLANYWITGAQKNN